MTQGPLHVPDPNEGLELAHVEQILRHHTLRPGVKVWEKAWNWISDRLNPIVIKEIRQSLKSRQFVISFGLTLIAAVTWTVMAIAILMPRILYLPGGVALLNGFFLILIIPLMVLIPAGAFLSLALEKQESTYELLSISSLSASQIIYGKMASAMVQLMLYVSALTPCIVLTYLLRGVSLTQILVLLCFTIVFSISETVLALLFAAVSKTALLQAFVGILMLCGLFGAAITWFAFVVSEGGELSSLPPESYTPFFAILTCVALAIGLALRAAAAAIDFPSENNSTPLRLRLFALVSLTLFWVLVGIAVAEDFEPLIYFLYVLFFFFIVIGALITGELGVISPRAQRGLPKTFFGRIFLTWLYPGSGMGYLFLMCLFAGVVITCVAMEFHMMWNVSTRRNSDTIVHASYFLLCHLVFYVGLNRLLMLLLPKTLPNRMLASFATMSVVMIIAHMGPLLLVYYQNDYRNFPYDWHQAMNVVWSFKEATSGGGIGSTMTSSAITMALLALGVFCANLLLCSRDVLVVRVSEPPRVRDDTIPAEVNEAAQPDPFG